MNYAAATKRADAMIRRKGAPATLSWAKCAKVDFVTHLPNPPKGRCGTVTMVAFPFKLRNAGSDRLEGAVNTLTHERRFVMSALALPVRVEVGMTIEKWEGADWTIDGLAPVAPDGSSLVLFTGTMRR